MYLLRLARDGVYQSSIYRNSCLCDHRSRLSFSWWHYNLVSECGLTLFPFLIILHRQPMNNTPSATTVSIQVRQRYSWRRSFLGCMCTNLTILSQSMIGDSSSVPCYTGTCIGWTSLSTQTACTDFSANLDVSSGEKVDLRTVNVSTSFSIGFYSSAWFTTLVVGSNSAWNVITRINTIVRPDGYINSSPVPTTLPIIYKAVGVTHVHVVQISDFDSTDVLRCRWATNTTTNFNNFNECGGICNGVPGAVLFPNNCTLQFSLINATWYAAVALQIEDYYNASATTPMSSVSLQFLFYGYTPPTGCSAQPIIIGNRPNQGESYSEVNRDRR